MHLFELHEVIENGENGGIEFKRKFSSAEKIAKEMIAFANTKGGKIIFGVDDNKQVVGVDSEKGELELIGMAAKFHCDPEVEYSYDIIQIYGMDVIVLDIKESRRKPHGLVGAVSHPMTASHRMSKVENEPKFYIRIKDKSVLASRETVHILKRSNPDSPPLLFSIGNHEKFLLDYLADNEKVTLKNFRKLLNISERRASRILVNLVRAELLRLHTTEREDFYTLS